MMCSSPSQEVGRGIDITHTPNTMCSSQEGLLTLQYPPNMMCSSLQVRGGGVLTLYIPPNTMCSSPQIKRWKGIDITHTPQHDMLKSPSQEVGGVLTLHIPPNMMCSSLQVKRWGGVLTLHIPPNMMCSSLQVKRWGGGGIYITHTPPTWCAQVFKSRGRGYWHYTYPPPLDLETRAHCVGGYV